MSTTTITPTQTPASKIVPIASQFVTKHMNHSCKRHELENNPYKVMFGSGDWTRTIAKWKRRMVGPWQGLDWKVHPPTGKSFELEFCTVARWKDGGIVDEKLFYDQVSVLRQIGVL